MLLACQDTAGQPSPTAPHHLPAPEAPPSVEMTQPSLSVAMDTAPLATPPVQVKEESQHGYNSEDTSMDTHPGEEAEPCERGGEELDISFDSQFPDLLSDLITEEANPAPPTAATTATSTASPSPGMFPTGVRYVVPPQPSPSSSFLPFPHPMPSSSTRLASITDFSPEWSYPEVILQIYCVPGLVNY